LVELTTNPGRQIVQVAASKQDIQLLSSHEMHEPEIETEPATQEVQLFGSTEHCKHEAEHRLQLPEVK
jgi:hypothetical protein